MTLTEQQNAIVVPATAIQNGPNGQYVFIVKDDHTVDLRDVKVARAEGNVSVIATGLTPGETVVTVGQLRLAPGTKVSIAEAKASV
jgi:multidrug efflux system membrane fusion protein